ncbi:MAG: PKD domain-containing protein [Crocinitomicaceae bacterium]|nr:PKD domain-containing protein [Crocinitomicaceae bacterium]
MKKLILLSFVFLSTFIVSAQCSADFTWTTSGNTVQLTNTSTGTYIHDWNFGDGNSSSATNPTHTYSSAGSYDICLYSYYIDSIGGFCDDSVCYQVTVIDSTGGGSSCNADFTWNTSGNTVFFTNTSTGTNSNDWWFDDGTSSSATNPTHTFAASGTYTVCLYSYYLDSVGGFCDDSVCYNITVFDSTGGSSCNADFTWSVSGNTVFFSNTSTGTNSNDWWFDDGTSSSATNPTHTFATSGTYTVCLYSYYLDSVGGFCDDSVCYDITVFDSTGGSSCNADFTWSVSGNTVQFTNTSSGTNNHDWWFDDGTSSTDTNPAHTYAAPGTYTICLYSYYLDSIGGFCDDSVCYDVTVFDSLDSTAGTAVLSFNEFQLYPNPTNSVINIQFDQLASNSHALIVDMLGREMIEVDLTTQVTEVQVAQLPKGIYLVQLFDANNRIIGLSKFVRK